MELKPALSFIPENDVGLLYLIARNESDTLGDECMIDELRYEDNILEWMSLDESVSVSVQQQKIASLAKCRHVAPSFCIGSLALE